MQLRRPRGAGYTTFIHKIKQSLSHNQSSSLVIKNNLFFLTLILKVYQSLSWTSSGLPTWKVWCTHTHPFNGPFSGTTRVSWYQKGKINLDFTEARDSEWQWYQLGCVQVCTSLQADNHTSTPPLSFITGKTSLDLNEARDDGVWGCSCTSGTTCKRSCTSGTTCKQTASCSRQIITSITHHSIFYRSDALPAIQPTASKH